MAKLLIFLTVVLITFNVMAVEESTFRALQDHLWSQGLVEEELSYALESDYLPEELAVALEQQQDSE